MHLRLRVNVWWQQVPSFRRSLLLSTRVCTGVAEDYINVEATEIGDYELCFINEKMELIQSLRKKTVSNDVRYVRGYGFLALPPPPLPFLLLCRRSPPPFLVYPTEQATNSTTRTPSRMWSMHPPAYLLARVLCLVLRSGWWVWMLCARRRRISSKQSRRT